MLPIFSPVCSWPCQPGKSLCQGVSSWEKTSAHNISCRIKVCVELDAVITPCVWCRLVSDGHQWLSNSSKLHSCSSWLTEHLYEFVLSNFSSKATSQTDSSFPQSSTWLFCFPWIAQAHKHLVNSQNWVCTWPHDIQAGLHTGRSHWI